jgi:hypothetical protein
MTTLALSALRPIHQSAQPQAPVPKAQPFGGDGFRTFVPEWRPVPWNSRHLRRVRRDWEDGAGAATVHMSRRGSCLGCRRKEGLREEDGVEERQGVVVAYPHQSTGRHDPSMEARHRIEGFAPRMTHQGEGRNVQGKPPSSQTVPFGSTDGSSAGTREDGCFVSGLPGLCGCVAGTHIIRDAECGRRGMAWREGWEGVCQLLFLGL